MTPTLARLGLCALLASTVLGVAAAPSPAALKALKAAQDRLTQREQLHQQTLRAASEARQLAASVQATRTAWEASRQAGAAARDAVAAATDCQAQVPQALEAQARALDDFVAAQALSTQAVQAVVAADRPSLERAARASDTAFQRRATAEQGADDQREALRSLVQRCSSATRQADMRLDLAFDQQQTLTRRVTELPAQQRELQTRWAEAAAGHRAAARAGWVGAPPPDLTLPDGEVGRSLARAMSPAPTRGQRASDAALLQLRQPPADPLPRAQSLARLLDAVAYLELVNAPSACADAAGCDATKAEQRELAPRIAQAQEQLRATRLAASAAAREVASLSGPLRVELLAHHSALTLADTDLERVLNDAAADSQSADAALRTLQARADSALAQAEADWESAWRQAHGRAPEPRVNTVPLSAKLQMQARPAPSAAMSAAIDLRSHAYEFFEGWNTERKGFGAYTYVLMRSDKDLNNADSRRRFTRLLETLQKLPEAHLVDPTQTRHVNLFCIPGTRAEQTGALPVKYDSDLGQQLKLRTQNGLMTRKEVSQRLVASPGPFLITLPGRMADVSSSAPLLFADLSAYPDDAIADLATHYMNGLVNDFPSQQLLWKPPVLQRVALVMIHLATGTGDMVSTLMPTAQAAPR
ncbi:hypothetical protein [Hydrogenophaga sp.]|uniref:hypothetical protein n=1 Tax=Hydrogenophaga sp. TaxID=1904254 RepID=UPI003AF441B7